MEEEKKVETQSSTLSNPEVKKDPVSQPNNPESRPVISKKKSNKTWIFVVIAVILIAAILLILFLPKSNNGTTTEKYNMTYSVYSQGVLVDSGTSTFDKGKVSTGLGLSSDELDNEISTMTAGQEKNITLEAKDAYGAYDSSLNFSYPRIQTQNRTNDMNRTTWITTSDFTQAFNEQPVKSQSYNLSGAPWLYKVVDLNSTSVKISQEAQLNQEIPFGEFKYKVVGVTDSLIKLRLDGNDTIIPTDNGNYIINFTSDKITTTYVPEIGSSVSLTGYPEARVTGMNATDVFLDANNPDAGKTVTITVKLNNIEKVKSSTSSPGTKNNGPTMEVFIMSHCPYGTQMVKGVLPVWRALKDKANIELRFVSYTMHGAQEDLDNNRILCIREEQNSKLIDYLDCFVHADGTEAGAQSCISSVGIDKSKLDDCVSNRASGYYDVDKQLNTQYGVQGSPTVILDGKEVSVYPRDPQSVANALCGAFTSKPSECSQSFSTTNPAAGFGPDSSGSGSSSSGSCSS